jgi:arylsulfatase A-like enzyme
MWYGPLAYAVVLGGIGLAGGLVLSVLPMDLDEIRGWTPSLALLATAVPMGLFITFFRVRRDLYAEQMPPVPVLLAIVGAAGLLALVLFFLGPRLFRTRIGGIFRPIPALILAAVVLAAGGIASSTLVDDTDEVVAAEPVPPQLADRPNLILVLVDTLRADHLDCYGSKHTPTPNLCSIAGEDGSIFDGFSHASWTKPSSATILTSLLPSSHGAMSKPAALSDEIVFLPEVLKDRGYATGGIVSNINLAPSFGFDQGYDEYHYLAPDYIAGADESSSHLILYQIARRVYFKIKGGIRVSDFYQPADRVNEVAFDFLDRHKDSRFFLLLHYMDPHDPYMERPLTGKGIARASNQHPDPEMAREMHRLYVGEIAFLDAEFGKLLAKLHEDGIYDDTVIALVADHGEEFMEHGGYWHGLTLYEEMMRVPLMVKWQKGKRGAPHDARGPVHGLLDVAPTLIAQSGAPIPETMQGIDLTGTPSTRPKTNKMVFAEEDHEGNVLRAVRSETWKYIEANAGNPRGLAVRELFKVAEDPGETANVIDTNAYMATSLQEEASALQTLATSKKVGGSEAHLDDAEMKALCALGYVECEDG